MGQQPRAASLIGAPFTIASTASTFLMIDLINFSDLQLTDLIKVASLEQAGIR